MSTSSLIAFLTIVAIGSYMQAFTGFALGIFVLGAAVILDLVKVETVATAINIMTLANTAFALRGNLGRLNRKLALQTMIGVLPGVPVGLWILQVLSARSVGLLHLSLGVAIFLGGAILWLCPRSRSRTSRSGSFVFAGAIGGVLGGMFSVPGPPIIYQFYVQPLCMEEVRLTLLGTFGAISLLRVAVLGIHGSISLNSVYLGMLSLPVVSLVTVIFIRFPPPVSERACRRIAFLLLSLMGLCIIVIGI